MLQGTSDSKFQFRGATIYNSNTGLYEGRPPAEGFSISGLSNGVFYAVAQAVSGERGMALIDARKEVERLGRVYKSARIVVGRPLQLSGRVIAESGAPLELSGAQVMLSSAEPVVSSPPAVPLGSDGTFILSSVQAGTYLLKLSGLPEDAYVKSARAGGMDVLERLVEVRYGGSYPIEVLLNLDGGRLTGTTVSAAGRPFAGADIVLVPDPKLRHRVDQYRMESSDRTGSFTIRGIPPGDYKLFAWEKVEPNAYLNADFMREYEELGVAVSIKPGVRAAFEVRTIPARY
jgi:hypothetical protein